MRALLLICLTLLAAAHALPPPPDSSRPCWAKMIEIDGARDPDGALPPGGEEVRCDSKGFFLPMQCSGSQCYCVKPNGRKLKYTQNRWEADDMKCKCALEEANAGSGVGASVRCDDRGDYYPVQCQGTVCHCVHTDTGEEKIGTTSNIIDIARLEADCIRGANR